MKATATIVLAIALCISLGYCQDACQQERQVGPCKALMWRYFYDSSSGECKEFGYGGCGGNANNFMSIEECQAACSTKTKSESKSSLTASSVCGQPKKEGPCMAAFTRFFYNSETNKCEEFYYGGCLGNDNNFHSQEECVNTCEL